MPEQLKGYLPLTLEDAEFKNGNKAFAEMMMKANEPRLQPKKIIIGFRNGKIRHVKQKGA